MRGAASFARLHAGADLVRHEDGHGVLMRYPGLRRRVHKARYFSGPAIDNEQTNGILHVLHVQLERRPDLVVEEFGFCLAREQVDEVFGRRVDRTIGSSFRILFAASEVHTLRVTEAKTDGTLAGMWNHQALVLEVLVGEAGEVTAC